MRAWSSGVAWSKLSVNRVGRCWHAVPFDMKRRRHPERAVARKLKLLVRLKAQAGQPACQLFQRNPKLDLGELLTDTEMDAIAESEIVARILAGDVERAAFGNTASSRLAEPSSNRMLAPVAIGVSPICASFSALRRHATIDGL